MSRVTSEPEIDEVDDQEAGGDGLRRNREETETRRRGSGFVRGVVTGIVVTVFAIVAYLVVTDDDEDGQLDIDVPNIDVGADEEPG
jgi:hypothetical protein